MSIKINGTEVINDLRELTNITNLKTVNGNDILGSGDIITHPNSHPPSIIEQDANNRFVTDAEKTNWSAKQDAGNYALTDHSHNVVDDTTPGFMTVADKSKLDQITGINTGDQTDITGNAGTATLLQNPRTINGVVFDGSSDITINAVDSTARIAASKLGIADGVATLNALGKVPASQLPSYVDDVLEFDQLSSFPSTGSEGTFYISLDTGKVYRWTGADYTHITSVSVDSVNNKTGVVVLDKNDIGLENVDNTSDLDKPVSTAQANEIATAKSEAATDATTKANAAQDNAIAASAPVSHVGSTGTSHGVATTTDAGFMAAEDKGKLDGIQSGATFNSTDAQLRDRSSHTGTQAISTVDGLQIVLDGKAESGHTHAVVTTAVSGLMSNADKNKLDGIADGANAYVHPDTHPASIIAQDASNRFVTDAEKAAWNAKQPAGIYATGTGSATGVNTGDQTTITGNAGSATVLQTARTINGVAFNGSANITINAVDATARIASSEKGVVNGVATLGADGKVPSTQLPSFVDDVLEFANLAELPAPGETGKIYVALDTNKTYRWSGSAYVYITSGAVDSVAGKTGVVALVKADVGLGNVDNTSDAAKPVSAAQSSAISNAQVVAATDATNKANAAQAAAIAASAPVAHVGSTGAAHGVATTTVAGFMSGADKTKLDGIQAGATTYTHPANHPASIIVQDASNRFVTDAEKAAWNAKQPAGTYATGTGTATGTNTGDQTTITGNAGSATSLQTARTINGTSFNGTADITTPIWGKTRTFTLGNTGKSVDGSGNVGWSLSEIGAQSENQYLNGISNHTGSSGFLKKTPQNTWEVVKTPYDISYFVNGKPLSSEIVIKTLITREVIYDQNMPGSLAKCTTAPSSTVVFEIIKGTLVVGYITFNTGTLSGVFSTSSSITFSVGDLLVIRAPATQDATFSDPVFTIKGDVL